MALWTSPAAADPGGNGKAHQNTPAAKHGQSKQDHGNSKHNSPVVPVPTEDNDTNDGGTPNNVPDASDNAHPSGNDRSVEPGGSGNQGKAQSDPDGTSNNGPDKPNGSGGVDLADQDGNNGCGNDDDFEDDNNGNCGAKPPKPHVPPPTPPPTPPPPCCTPPPTVPVVVTIPGFTPAVTSTSVTLTEVLSTEFNRLPPFTHLHGDVIEPEILDVLISGNPPGKLPVTGLPTAPLMEWALCLMGIGAMLTVLARRRPYR